MRRPTARPRRRPSAVTSRPEIPPIHPHPHFPASLILEGRTCVVFGPEPDAHERVAALAEHGAHVRRGGAPPWDEVLAGAFLVVIELALPEPVAQAIAHAARAVHALVYAVDRPGLSDLALPAVARRGLLSVAVSTSGASPLLARRLREELERVLPERLGALTVRLAALRASLAHLPRDERIRRLTEALADLHLEGHLDLPDDA